MLRTRTNDEVLILKLVIGEDLIYEENETFGLIYRVKNYNYDYIHNFDIICLNGNNYYKKYCSEYNTSYYDIDETGVLQTLELINYENNNIFFVIYEVNTVDYSVFNDLVEATPTDVRLVEDEDGKLQLQLEHDSEVLSVDEGVNDLLGKKFGYSREIFPESIRVEMDLIFNENDLITFIFDSVTVSYEYDGWRNIEDFTNALTSDIFFGKYVVYDNDYIVKNCGICTVCNNVLKFDDTSLNSLPIGRIESLSSYYLLTGETYGEI